MTDIEKLAKKQKRKEISLKVAEILWLGIGGAIALCGIICLVLGFIINNIGSRTSVNTYDPFIGLIDAQEGFKTWWNGWFFIKMSTFLGLGSWLLIVACAYELIVIAIYANKDDAKEKREKARKLRERNARKFKEDQQANEALKSQEQAQPIEANTVTE